MQLSCFPLIINLLPQQPVENKERNWEKERQIDLFEQISIGSFFKVSRDELVDFWDFVGVVGSGC